MGVPYTLGIWDVQPGKSAEFVTAWTEFADWTKRNVPGAGWGKLLRDLDNENRFFTFGPWDSLEAIETWRSLDGWKERVSKIRALLTGFQPATLETVVERG